MAERTIALSDFLDALDEWGCEDSLERAEAIIAFIDSGYDLSEYEKGTTFCGTNDLASGAGQNRPIDSVGDFGGLPAPLLPLRIDGGR